MNGLDLIRATLAEWRRNRGDETTFYKCQHFDGWYVQWALQGFRDDSSIRVYSTAQIAADASPMFTRRINDKAIQAGDRLYFRFGVPGHIVTAVGWDGDRLLVSNTANGGDTLIALSNNVKIHHADTIDLPFIGASRQNGSNRGIRVNNYIHGAGSPAGSTPSQEDELDAYERRMLEHIYFSMTPGIEGTKFNGDGYNKILDAAGHAQVARESAQRIEKVVVGDFDRQGGVMGGKTNLSSVIAWFDQNMIVIRQLVENSATDTAKRITAELAKVPGVDPKVVQDAVAKAIGGTALDPKAIAKSVAEDLARRLQS